MNYENTRIVGFSDDEMEFQFIRQLGAGAYRASSIGECFTIANKIQNSNHEEWVREFERLADWQKEDGMERLVKNHVVSGREQLFRASNSYRAAEYYAPRASELNRKLGLNSADCFCSAISAMDLHFENHSIPYGTINLPAYFISPANDGVKRKTLMIVSGFDGTMEEEFFFHGFAGIERGYNVILFAGPGSIDVLRKYPESYYKPDFDAVVKRIINHFEFRHEIDMHHLSLMGNSTGAYFAIQAACHEPRIKALIANPPILDLNAYLGAFVNKDQASFKASFEYLKSFTIGSELNHIDIPCLAMTGKQVPEQAFKQFQEFCKHTNADDYEFSEFEGAASHCQVGNISFANAIAYDWLDNL